MKKIFLKVVSLIILCGILASQTFATNIIYPGMNIISSDATNVVDANLQKMVSDQIRLTISAIECKNAIQDVNALGTIKFGNHAFAGYSSVNNPIEWIVLEKNNAYAILLSKNVLGQSEYNEANNAVEFNGTKISKWIERFYLTAFTDAERAIILSTAMPTKSDVNKYFTFIDGTKRLGLAYNDGSYATGGNGLADYWLKNEGVVPTGWYFSTYADCYEGQFGEKFGVRPMIMVQLVP